MKARVAIVTGTASGLGKAIAFLLAEHGIHVIAGSLTAADDEQHPLINSIFLDLTQTDSIQTLVDYAINEYGHIDYLINNAGIAQAGPIENFTRQHAENLFAVNFFGAVELCRLVLAFMRERRQGKIINISSGAGITAQPFAGFYSASKYALEGYSESLRHEVKAFNIDISLVEYNWINTGVINNAQQAEKLLDDYQVSYQTCEQAINAYCAAGMSAEQAAKTVLKIINTNKAKLRYRVGKDVHSSYWSRKIFPEFLFEKLVKSYYKL